MESANVRTTWRQLLVRYGGEFLRWLDSSGKEIDSLRTVATTLAGFLIDRLERARVEWPETPTEFWRRIPDVRRCCSSPGLFDEPLTVEAYAFVHMLERYRRTWATLRYLCENAVLPLGATGVNVLDVGTGPASALYAIDDFYRHMSQFAQENGIAALVLPPPTLNSVERNRSMASFFHHYSAFSGRSGPFGPTFVDFTELNLPGERASYLRHHQYESYWNPDFGAWDDMFDPDAVDIANSLHRYRFVMFSNFLTAAEHVEQFETSLRLLFRDLRPGAAVVVLGGTGDEYQDVYLQLTAIVRDEGFGEATWRSGTVGRIGPEDVRAQIIKSAQHRVYEYLARVVGPDSLPRTRQWPDYWNERPSSKARPRFALHAFRRGHWPHVQRDTA